MNSEQQQSDLKLVNEWRSGKECAAGTLIKKYEDFVKMKARSYFLIGGEREDLAQEGMIGLYRAIQTYDTARDVPFRNYAELCVTRQILTAIKTASRQKHQPLNSSLSLDYELEDSEPLFQQVSTTDVYNPEWMMLYREQYELFEKQIETKLSSLEREVYFRYIQGSSYDEIATALKKPVKSIDNALQRIKKKLNPPIL